MRRYFVICVFFLASFPINASDNYAGIWRDKSLEGRFYSIHDNGNQLVIIDLYRLEYWQNPLVATYISTNYDVNTAILSPIESAPTLGGDLAIQIVFQSDLEAIITLDPSIIAFDGGITILEKLF